MRARGGWWRMVAANGLLGLGVASAGARAASAAAPPPDLDRIDALYARRDAPGALNELRSLTQQTLAQHPDDYGTLWRAARLLFWEADRPGLPSESRTTLARQGWQIGERAAAARPDDVAGHFWTAANVGTYGLGIGALRALHEGLEGKFKGNLQRAEALAPDYEHGAIDVAWGRFYQEAPRPKRDLAQAEAHYRRALQRFPDNLRARVYLADLLSARDPAGAQRLLEQVLASPVGRRDPPEDRRAQELARSLLTSLRAAS